LIFNAAIGIFFAVKGPAIGWARVKDSLNPRTRRRALPESGGQAV